MKSSRGDREEEGARTRPYGDEPPALVERAGLVSLEWWERAADAATRGASVAKVRQELQGDEEEDEYEDLEEKPPVKTEPPAQVAQVS
ncbi:hypothetical protein PF002_g1322 [Phytophthora fragariae]|uniref:Uncharacterized protein n=1 Tax=Phytophthora fragariae TaxID=53985 RepID=A0A6A4AD98_9STRA|nr:hypothetical protein PF011_g932 [Phytophthora fragariae]KAE9257106.1 hypothetical protein PF002_g1322 [Phytophthora fragariae]